MGSEMCIRDRPGVDTLSTKIYSEVRKGIKPEMYALSTLMFVTVLALLLIVNLSPSEEKLLQGSGNGKKTLLSPRRRRLIFGRVIPAALAAVILVGGFYYGSKTRLDSDNQVIVYNWGEYIDPEVLDLFEEETGIQVVYDEYETNEMKNPKIKS